MATEVLQLGIDSTGAAQGARQFERATASVQQSATKADTATNRLEGSFDRLRRQVLIAERALGALGITIGSGALVRGIAQATGEMDRMRRGLVAIMGSASAAGRELETLRQIALAPGIDLQSAVRGATQLQAVGIGLKTTNRALVEFANAVALSGKGAPELERVFLQLQQLSSKGKVIQQDLRPILEAAPAVSQALVAAFGTVNAQDIEALGLTSDQFLSKLLDYMAKLPRATGGVTNSWENLKSAVFQASAAFGENFVGAVSRAMDALANSLTALSQNRALLRGLADGVTALAKALLVGGAVAGVLRLVKAMRELAAATALVDALKGPTGWLVLGVAALATYLYKQGSAARDAASAINDYANSLSNLSRQGLLNQQAGLNLSATYLQSQLAAQPATIQKGLSMGTGGGGRLINVPNPEVARLQGQLDTVIRQSVAVAAALSATDAAKTGGGGGQGTLDEDTITKAMNAAFDRFAVKYGFLMPRLAENADIIAARGGLGQAGLLGIPNFAPVNVAKTPAEKVTLGMRFGAAKGYLSQGFDALKKGDIGGAGSAVVSAAGALGPLALAAAALTPVFKGLKDALGPAISALAAPLEVVGKLFGSVLAPVLNLVAPPLRLIAKVASYVVEGLGYIVLAAGKAAGALSFGLAGKGLRRTGDEIIAGARDARHSLENLGTSADKLAASLSTDLPKAINLALYRARIGAPGGGSVTGGPVGSGPIGGGGIGSGYHPPIYTPGNHPQPTPAGVVISIGQYHSAANETPEDAARKMAKGAQILYSRNEKLYAPGLVTAA